MDEGNIDEDLLARAFTKLVARHEILRTRFVYKNETPYQYIVSKAVLEKNQNRTLYYRLLW